VVFHGAGRSRFVGKEHASGVVVQTGHDQDASTTLRKPERARIDDSVRPSVAELFERGDDHLKSTAFRQLQHEGYVLQEEPGYALLFEEPEDLTDQARTRASDAFGLPSLAEILAREATREKLGLVRERPQSLDVSMDDGARETRLQDCGRRVVELAQQLSRMSRSGQAQLDTADPSEQSRCGKGHLGPG
jgi:hypothetical protein